MTPPDRHDRLVVVTPRAWLADDFRPACRRAGVPLSHSYGLDVPLCPAAASWWAPTAWAARALRAAPDLFTLESPGTHWPSRFDQAMLGRRIDVLTVHELVVALDGRTVQRSGFGKLAEVKTDDLPPRWWPDLRTLLQAAGNARLPAATVLQVTATRLDITAEWRAFVHDGAIAAFTPYRFGDAVWGSIEFPAFVAESAAATASARGFALDAARHATAAGMPAGWVLGVAELADGRHVVVEANPAWSSMPYDADMDGVLATVLAANTATDPAHTWVPDPYLARRAEVAALLRVSPPA